MTLSKEKMLKRFTQCASALLCLCLSLFFVASGAAAEFPDKPLRLIIPYPPGGGTDILARLIASKVSEAMKWNIVTENRPGAGGSIGIEAAARATPDGYTLALAETSNLAINPSLYSTIGYDPETDFAPIMFIGSLPLVLVVSADSQYQTLASLVADAKKNQLSMASAGNGTVGHLAGEMFKIQAGIPILHAPYKGAAPAINDILGGRITLFFGSLPSLRTQIAAGKLRALAVTSSARASVLPDVPTFKESGYPEFEATVWYGLLAPKGVSPDLIAQLHKTFLNVLGTNDMRDRLSQDGVQFNAISPEEFGAWIKAERAKWGAVVRQVGAKID